MCNAVVEDAWWLMDGYGGRGTGANDSGLGFDRDETAGFELAWPDSSIGTRVVEHMYKHKPSQKQGISLARILLEALNTSFTFSMPLPSGSSALRLRMTS